MLPSKGLSEIRWHEKSGVSNATEFTTRTMRIVEQIGDVLETKKPENTAFPGFLTDFVFRTRGLDGTRTRDLRRDRAAF